MMTKRVGNAQPETRLRKQTPWRRDPPGGRPWPKEHTTFGEGWVEWEDRPAVRLWTPADPRNPNVKKLHVFDVFNWMQFITTIYDKTELDYVRSARWLGKWGSFIDASILVKFTAGLLLDGNSYVYLKEHEFAPTQIVSLK